MHASKMGVNGIIPVEEAGVRARWMVALVADLERTILISESITTVRIGRDK